MIEVLNVFEASYNTLHVSEAWTPLPKRFMSPFPLPLYSTFIDKVIWVCLPYRFGLCGSIMSRWRHLLGKKGFWHTVLSPKSRHQFAVFVFSVTLTSWKVDILRDAAPEIVMEGQRCHDNYFYWFWWYLPNWFKSNQRFARIQKRFFVILFAWLWQSFTTGSNPVKTMWIFHRVFTENVKNSVKKTCETGSALSLGISQVRMWNTMWKT